LNDYKFLIVKNNLNVALLEPILFCKETNKNIF